MNHRVTPTCVLTLAVVGWLSNGLSGCGDDGTADLSIGPGPGEESLSFELRYQTEADASCHIASPLAYTAADGTLEILTVTISGVIRAFDADNGEERWRLVIDAPDGESPIVLSTPRRIDNLLILAWSSATARDGLPDQGSWRKTAQLVQVLDLDTRAWHPDYPRVELAATKTAWDGATVDFDATKQMIRPRIGYLPDGDGLGLAYVGLGVGAGGQPYHGWLFELDLDAWRQDGAEQAIRSVLLTTADTDCTFDNETLVFAEVCGGGIWTPGGPLETVDLDGNPELIVPSGNGRVHIPHQSYAHGLLRVQPGLEFDPGCDLAVCQDFNEFDPDPACLQTCRNYFVPRLPPGQTFEPEQGTCDGETFMECYGTLDADFGSSTPVDVTLPSGRRVLVMVPKDGAVYLVDREHLGTLLDRLPVIEPCGTPDDPCAAGWAGQFVTRPVVYREDGETLVIAAGFNFDRTHAAGIVAVRIVDANPPSLELAWTAPDFETSAAVDSFRRHPGLPILNRIGMETYVIVVEPRSTGRLWAVRARDGRVVALPSLQSYGTRYSTPLLIDNALYVATCSEGSALAGGSIEVYDIAVTRDGEPVDFDAGTGDDVPTGGLLCEPGGVVCGPDEYCERQVCAGPGACLPRPGSCDTAGPAVCGCDGRTYANRCEANLRGAHAAREGACR